MSSLSQLEPRPVKSSSNTQDDIVYEHIFDAILEQRLAPGTKLSEEALGEIFGVSRTIIRRALLRLSHEQVVSIRPNRGAVVAAPSVEEARQIFAARRVVELAVIELAVKNATPESLQRIRTMVQEEQDAFARGDRGKGIRLSGEFHLELAHMANNTPLLNFQRSVVSQTSLIIAQYEVGHQAHCSFNEHEALLQSIESGDPAKAIAMMTQHLDHIQGKLNLDNESASTDLHVVFSGVVKKKPGRSR
ncbi:GntR family transcriptional regulator [Oceanisphaera arctica]|uniref:GntR family transcriptional regulator n=1 Tax=Oceanisphaera arctica TaxID=641510 RepID=A0A2P5TNC5_9GAMM|nr:GntR family transcriptional regulator [Oceanisphaera arctica]PPL17022.1 GntR family transcriptional regulator [Oceanisphaera arctica]GHA07322.1 GntR family transcriptional regulator [Oceanisphaera arctica]